MTTKKDRTPKDHVATAPRIAEQSAKFVPSVFSSLNAGLEYILDSFPSLYRRTLHDMKGTFSKGELMLMIDVMNGTMLTPQFAGQHLPASVADGIDLDGLASKWEIDAAVLNATLSGLTIFQLACLEIWANGFWYRQDKEPRDEKAFEIWLAQVM